MFLNLIFKDTRFKGIFWAQFFGAFNDNFFKNIFVLLLVYKSIALWGQSANSLVAMSGGIFILPYFLFSATAGQISDRWSKSKLVLWTKATEVLVMLLAWWAFSIESWSFLFVVLFLMGAQSTFFGPVKYGIIPRLVSPANLVAANAWVSGGTFVAILGGTILGGLGVSLVNDPVILGLGPVLVAILGVFTALKVPYLNADNQDLNIDWAPWRSTPKVMMAAKEQKTIFVAILGISWFWFLGAAVLSLLPGLAKNILYADESVSTLFLACFTLGMGGGAVLTERISRKKIEIGLVPIAILGMGIALLGLFLLARQWSYIPSEVGALIDTKQFLFSTGSLSWKILAALFLFSLMGGIFIVPQIAFIQVTSATQKLSQIIAANNIWNAFFMVAAAIFVMVLLPFGLLNVFVWLGFLSLFVSVLFYLFYSEECLRLWMKCISKVFYRVSIKGSENIPVSGPFIVISNHMSYLDWMLIMGAMPHPVRFVIDYNFYYLPMGPLLFSQAKLVPIATQKEDPLILKKAFDGISEHLRSGAIVGFFPEGKITRNQRIGRFQPGLAKVLLRDPVPVLPMCIDGVWGSIFSYSKGRLFFKWPISWRKRIQIHFAPLVKASDYNPDELKKWMKETVADYKLVAKVPGAVNEE